MAFKAVVTARSRVTFRGDQRPLLKKKSAGQIERKWRPMVEKERWGAVEACFVEARKSTGGETGTRGEGNFPGKPSREA